MENKNNKKGLANLTKKAAAVFGAALAALTGVDANAPTAFPNDNFESNTIQVKEVGKVKPMPILKLNLANPDASRLVANHTSHYSHSSHSSHRSHYSHYSHRSGAMFS
jgi:hypothetical protein